MLELIIKLDGKRADVQVVGEAATGTIELQVSGGAVSLHAVLDESGEPLPEGETVTERLIREGSARARRRARIMRGEEAEGPG